MDLASLRKKILACEWTWLIVYSIVAIIATAICVARRCNNFLIFRAAFEHLLTGADLYALHPSEHSDLFKYSPTFALLFAPFARLPFAVALLAWNLLNVLSIFQAIRLALPGEQRLPALQLIAVGLITTVDGTQSNGLVAAVMVLAFAALERDRLWRAVSMIGMGTLIKLFPLAAAVLALPRRDRWRFAAMGVAMAATLLALPLLVTGGGTLVAQYRSWYAMSAMDALDRGASVMRLLHVTTGYDGPNWPIQLAGTALLLLPLLLRRAAWETAEFRRAFLASLLVYCVIFNHKAEQPSFVIAVVGVAIWFAISPRSPVRNVLTIFVFASTVPVLIAVAAPGWLTRTVDGPLLITSACCVAAWFTMQGELLELFAENPVALPLEQPAESLGSAR